MAVIAEVVVLANFAFIDSTSQITPIITPPPTRHGQNFHHRQIQFLTPLSHLKLFIPYHHNVPREIRKKLFHTLLKVRGRIQYATIAANSPAP